MILGETQVAIRAMVHEFVQVDIRPHSAVFEAASGYPSGLSERMAASG